MNSFIYAGNPDKNMKWKFIPNTNEAKKQAILDGYTAFSVYGYEFEPTKNKKDKQPMLYGDLVLDFDCKENPKQAHQDAVAFLKFLEDEYQLNLHTLKYWLSGVKGVHVSIPAATFCEKMYGDQELNKIHETMLRAIHKEYFLTYAPAIEDGEISSWSTLDLSLYANKRILREENILRPQGCYKVPVSCEEFFNSSFEYLQSLTKSQRSISAPCIAEENLRLTELYIEQQGILRSYSTLTSQWNLPFEKYFLCDFVKHCKLNEVNLAEPQWFMLARLFQGIGNFGIKAFFELSQNYPRFDRIETYKKIIHARSYPIPTCTDIQENFKCSKDCKVKSPIELWKKIIEKNQKFILKESGVYLTSELGEIFLCTYLKAIGYVRDKNSYAWSYLLEIKDFENTAKRIIIPSKAMYDRSGSAFGDLAEYGVFLSHNPKIRQKVFEYITSTCPKEMFLQVRKIGWHGNTYVLPQKQYGEQSENIYIDTKEHFYNISGSLEDWQENIGKYCVGNSMLELLVPYALTGPLLSLLGLEGGGIHIYGMSSTGKSTFALVAGSVCGCKNDKGFMDSWRMTPAALEVTACLSNDSFLNLDEIGQASGDTVSQATYMLINREGKKRMMADSSLRETYQWNINFLSTGEMTIPEKISENGKSAMVGQEVRVIDLPLDQGTRSNSIENIHDFAETSIFMQHLKECSLKYYGSVFDSFLEEFCKDKENYVQEIREDVKKFCEDNLSRFDASTDGQVERVLKKFALVSAVGELSIKLGVLKWEQNSVQNATQKWFDIWLEQRGTVTNLEIDKAIKKLEDFFLMYQDSAFAGLNESFDHRIHKGYVWGDGNEIYYLILTPYLSEVFGNKNKKALIYEFDKRGFLAHTTEDSIMETKSIKGHNKRGLCFIPKKWAGSSVEHKENQVGMGNVFRNSEMF